MFPPLWELTRFGPQVNPTHIVQLLKLKINSLVDLVQIEFPYGLFEVIPLLGGNTPLILDQHGVEVDFLREVHSSLGQSTGRLEAARVYSLERLAVMAASTVLCCSEHDRSRMNSLYAGPPSKYALVENGVDDEFFEFVSPFNYSSPTVLYLGAFSHSPNLYAMDWILKQVAPRVRRTVPNVKFVFVGSGTAPRVDGPMIIQDAADVRPYIRGADVALATVFHGSGSRLKILEYLACGVPVVATTKGMEGLNLRPGEDLLVANEPEPVATCITELITNKSLANRLASNGQRKTRSHYTWRAIISKAVPIYLRNVA
jgi:glycosyltransferase involved in cell wall biosynthesis